MTQEVPSARSTAAADDSRLRQTIRTLGNLLGETIIEQEGQAIFDLEEEIRNLSKAQRGGDAAAGPQIVEMANRLVQDLDRTQALLKAFTAYFQLINLAEEQQHVRVLRDRLGRAQSEGLPIRETVGAAIRTLKDEGCTAADVRDLLADLLIMPVFTAHPTESKRRTILLKLKAIAAHLYTLDMRHLLPAEEAEITERIREIIVALWQSDETRERRPTVLDEVRQGLYYFETTLFNLVPQIYAELRSHATRKLPRRRFRHSHFFALWLVDGRRP